MDTEQILTQILIAFFTVIFFVLACRVKSSIEKRYRKGTENLKHSKAKMKEISFKQTILCKKVLCESTNRHHRSIIAASLKQTLDEEMEKLEHIKDSIKLVQQIPNLKPSFHQFDRDFFPDCRGVSVFNLGSKEANSDTNEKCLVRGNDSRLQTKLCNAWRAQSRRYIKNSICKIKEEREKQLNDFKDKHIIGQVPQATEMKIHPLTNLMVNNVSIISFRDNHNNKSTKETLEKIVEMESCACENVNESKKNLADLNNSVISEKEQVITHTLSFENMFNTKSKQDKSNRYTKKGNRYSCLDTCSDLNNITENSNVDVHSESICFTTLNKSRKMENQLFLGKGISCRQTRHEKKYGKNLAFQFDFFYCTGNEPGVKIMVEHKNNKSVISYDTVEESLKVINLKMFQVSTKKNGNDTNTLVRYVFKLSLKINKKKVVFKCIISCFEKEKRDYKRLSYKANPHLQSNTNCCRVQSKHGSVHRKPRKKRHSLYTNTSFISSEERQNKHGDNIYNSVTLAKGDITLPALDQKCADFIVHDPRRHIANMEDQDSEVDRSILKLCVHPSEDCFTRYSKLFYTNFSPILHQFTPITHQLNHTQLPENETLSTIEMERTDDGEEHFEKITAKACHTLEFEQENNEPHKEQRLLGKFGRNRLVQRQPLFSDESNICGDQNIIQSEVHTSLNLKTSMILEQINSICLRENNSPVSNISQAPKSLTCVFELRNYDETMYMQNIFWNRLYDGILNTEDSTDELNIFQNRQLSSTNYSTSSTSVNDDKNVESHIYEYKEQLYDLDKVKLEKEEVGGTTGANSFFMTETVFVNNESDAFYFNTQNTPSAVVVMEGAMFSSSDSSPTIILDENESHTYFLDDELSKTSNST